MLLRNAFALFLAVVLCPAAALSQDARSIMETAREKQMERWEGVDVYVVRKSMMGNTGDTWFRRTEVTDEAGETHTAFVPDVYAGLRGGTCESDDGMTAEGLDAYADASEMTGNAMAGEIEDGLEEAGLPRGLLAATGTSPTATFDPRVIMGSNAGFLRAAADAKRQQAAADPGAEAMANAGQMEEFVDKAELVGKESIDGRNAFHLRATGLDEVQKSDGNEYRMDSVSMWIDAEEYVPLRMRVDGVMVSGKETKPMFIETTHSDYRTVPESNMYESYKQVIKIAGVLDEKQQKEMQEAQKQMAEFEQQMAAMPASQRQMMEQMMGPQLEMMRNMAAGDGFQMETVTQSIRVNPEMVGADGKPCR